MNFLTKYKIMNVDYEPMLTERLVDSLVNMLYMTYVSYDCVERL